MYLKSLILPLFSVMIVLSGMRLYAQRNHYFTLSAGPEYTMSLRGNADALDMRIDVLDRRFGLGYRVKALWGTTRNDWLTFQFGLQWAGHHYSAFSWDEGYEGLFWGGANTLFFDQTSTNQELSLVFGWLVQNLHRKWTPCFRATVRPGVVVLNRSREIRTTVDYRTGDTIRVREKPSLFGVKNGATLSVQASGGLGWSLGSASGRALVFLENTFTFDPISNKSFLANLTGIELEIDLGRPQKSPPSTRPRPVN